MKINDKMEPVASGLKKIFLASMTLVAFVGSAWGQPFLRLPSMIGDHMVLQADTMVKIYGWADP